MEENKEYTMSKTGIRETGAGKSIADGAADPTEGTDVSESARNAEQSSGGAPARDPFVSSHTRAQRVLAWVAIGMLLALTVTDFVLAIIGTEAAQNALKVMIVLTIMVPIILYFFVLMLKKRKGKD